MAIYTSDVNRFTGLSGVDTESMVDKMMKAESAKYERMEKDKTLLQWKQDSYRTLMDSMKSFQDKWFGIDKTNNISYDSFWNNYSTSVIDKNTGVASNAIKINSTTNSGSYDIEVTQKAETATITGGKLENNVLADEQKLKDLISKSGESEGAEDKKVSFKFNLDGVSKEITITKDELEKAESLEKVFNDKFDEAFGAGNVVAEKDKNNGGKIVFKPQGDGHTLSVSGGTESFEKTTNSITLNSKLTDIFGADFTSHKDNDDKNDEVTLNFGGKDIVLNKDDTIQTFINKVNSSDGDVKLEFNEVTSRFDIKAAQSGANGKLNINDTNTKDFLKNFVKIDVENPNDTKINTSSVEGKDAIFKINGVETNRPSNDISMNGINFTINSTGNVRIESKTDVDTTVKKVKEFVDDYNKLVDDIQKQVSKPREKSGKYEYYEPLTEEQKKQMSEDDIKKWEEKAKTGLLYNDDYLTKFLADLRNNVYKSVDIGGKNISLFEIGITTTSNYRDGGKLQIDEKKLRESLETRGDEVRQLFTKSKEGIGELIKKNFDDAIGSKGYLRNKAGMKGTASDMSNQLSKEMKDMTSKLAKERERLYNKEMQYFKLFSKMESAMNKQNSQLAALLSASSQ